jgi:hypothetical protein
VDFGGGPLASAGGSDVFVARYSGSNGSHLWSRRVGGTSDDLAWGVAVDGSGDVLVTGNVSDTVDFGGGPLASAGGSDGFMAKYSGSDGSPLWSRRFGGVSFETGNDVAVDGSGNVVVTGFFLGASEFGGDALESAGSYDVFVAKYSGSDGSHVWSRRFGSTFTDYGLATALEENGRVLVTGSFSGTVDFGDGVPLESAGAEDIFLLSLRP